MRFAIAFALVSLVAPATPTQAQTPEWIWLSKSASENQVVYFRKPFEIAGDIQSARLVVTCDNQLVAYVNGKQVAEHGNWQQPAGVDVTRHLAKGKNILAVRGQNEGGPAGLLARLEITTKDKKKQFVVSDASWQAAGKETKDWQQLGFAAADWKKPQSLGKLGTGPWGNLGLSGARPQGRPAPGQSTPAENIRVPEGFQVQRLYSVPKGEQGSWVGMATDPKGRLICSDQGNLGLYRVTPGQDEETTKVEKLNVNMSACQGLLHVGEVLYVTVNGPGAQGNALYAMRDTNGDDQYDEVRLLKKFQGGGEHGPHGIRLGPDNKLYIIAGNHTNIPSEIKHSPHRNWAEDLLLPRNPDGNGHATGRMAPGGWIARTDLEGKNWELFCAGFRNPYDIDFNQDGELFTFDADMEWDTGAPWYRPTRVNHCTSAAEFGWRYGTGKWADYFVDSRGAAVDIGLGSPTGIEFGTGARFPAAYQQALYINDWTYGKIYAVHLKPQGASYTATFETFVQARPLPVTDVVINRKDGALYFTVGGRGTQSGLYRVSYTGAASTAPAGPPAHPQATAARALRHKLEAFHLKQDPAAVEFVWEHLNSSDRAIRYAARAALERQELPAWREKALGEKRTNARIQALCALCRTGDKDLQAAVLERLNALPFARMSEEQTLDALRVYGLAFIRLGGKQEGTATKVLKRLSPLYPHESDLVNRELCRMLVYLEAPGVVERTMTLLKAAQTQQDQMFYVFTLRTLKNGWTAQQRQEYFSWMNIAQSKYKGGNSFKKFVIQIREDARKTLAAAELDALKDVLTGAETLDVVKLETTRQFVHNWQMDDLLPHLDEVTGKRSFEKGRVAFEAAQCFKCHRFQQEGGSTGPDITGVGNRFDAKYLLEAMIEPSKVVSDQYRNELFTTANGEVVTGRVIEETGKLLKVRSDPFARSLTEIKKDEIEERVPSALSEMPAGLVNVLSREEILDLVAYMRSGGNPDDPAFK